MRRDPKQYAVNLRPLSDEEGGGWLAMVPDLPGCVSDGETSDGALRNVEGAIVSWLEEAEEQGRAIPDPYEARGEWRQRVPRSLHAELKRRANLEGVSMNQFVTAVLSRYIGQDPSGFLQPSGLIDTLDKAISVMESIPQFGECYRAALDAANDLGSDPLGGADLRRCQDLHERVRRHFLSQRTDAETDLVLAGFIPVMARGKSAGRSDNEP